MSEFTRTRAEVEAFVERWLNASRACEKDNDWSRLAEFYAEDASYCYTIGSFGRREAHGREAIRKLVMERDTVGFDDWTFPYDWVVIDGDKIMTKWYMQPPFSRPDGSPYRVLGMSAIRLDDRLQIVEMEDSMDIAALFALVNQLKAAGHDVRVPTAPTM